MCYPRGSSPSECFRCLISFCGVPKETLGGRYSCNPASHNAPGKENTAYLTYQTIRATISRSSDLSLHIFVVYVRNVNFFFVYICI